MRAKAEVAAPSDDKRWRIVNATMRKHGYRPDALIETLHSVQEAFGYLDEDGLRYVAQSLHVSLSQVYGVATFYHIFQMKPTGEHKCVICMGTACYIKGSPAILEALHKQYDIKPGETTPDGKVSLLIARCIGACGLAPAGVFDEEIEGKLVPADVLGKAWRWTHDS